MFKFIQPKAFLLPSWEYCVRLIIPLDFSFSTNKQMLRLADSALLGDSKMSREFRRFHSAILITSSLMHSWLGRVFFTIVRGTILFPQKPSCWSKDQTEKGDRASIKYERPQRLQLNFHGKSAMIRPSEEAVESIFSSHRYMKTYSILCPPTSNIQLAKSSIQEKRLNFAPFLSKTELLEKPTKD